MEKLTKSEFKIFVSEIEAAFRFFTLWRMLKAAVDKRYLLVEKNEPPKEYAIEFDTNNFFWRPIIIALQDQQILSLRRLFDPAYGKRGKKARVSFNYLLNRINPELKLQMVQEQTLHKRLIDSLTFYRNARGAHNDLEFITQGQRHKIAGGSNECFVWLAECMKKIKKSDLEYKDCPDINLHIPAKQTEEIIKRIKIH